MDSLEQHADRARVTHLQLPGYVFRYCLRKVKRVIENMPELGSDDWVALRTMMIDLYGMNNSTLVVNLELFWAWMTKHGMEGSITSKHEVGKYYRQFKQLAVPLMQEPRHITEHNLNWCFYRGIPDNLRSRISRKVLTENETTTNSPTIENQMKWLLAEFDILSINDVRVPIVMPESEGESDGSDGESERRELKVERQRKKKMSKQEGPELTVKVIPGSQGLTDEIVKGMEQLRLTMVEGFRSRGVLMSSGTGARQPLGQRCGMGGCKCPGDHPYGYNNCPQTHKLLD